MTSGRSGARIGRFVLLIAAASVLGAASSTFARGSDKGSGGSADSGKRAQTPAKDELAVWRSGWRARTNSRRWPSRRAARSGKSSSYDLYAGLNNPAGLDLRSQSIAMSLDAQRAMLHLHRGQIVALTWVTTSSPSRTRAGSPLPWRMYRTTF